MKFDSFKIYNWRKFILWKFNFQRNQPSWEIAILKKLSNKYYYYYCQNIQVVVEGLLSDRFSKAEIKKHFSRIFKSYGEIRILQFCLKNRWFWVPRGTLPNAILRNSGQSYKHFTIVIYDSRVVPDWKIPHITTLES